MIQSRPTLLAPVVATVLLHSVLTAFYVRKHHGDPSSLACVGENRVGMPPYEAVTYHTPAWANGYDGQFYYVIARSPWQRQPQGLHGIDWSGPRQLRIMYPARCWLVSGGDARRLFWVMPAVNVAALAGLAALGAVTARRCGLSVWWGFALPFAVNARMPVLRDLTEPWAILGAFGLLAGWLLGSPWWVLAFWGGVAVLSRQQNVALVGLTMLGAVVTQRWKVAAGLAAVLCVWLAWVGYLHGLYGDWPFLPSEGNLGFPFAGILERWTRVADEFGGSDRTERIQAVAILQLSFEIAMGLYVARQPGDWIIRSCIFSGAALAVFAGRSIYGDLWSYGRVFFWVPLGVWLAATHRGWSRFLLLLTPACLSQVFAVLRWV